MKITTIHPRDVIAAIVILLGFVLLMYGKDGTIATLMLMVVTYYFSKRIYEEKAASQPMQKGA